MKVAVYREGWQERPDTFYEIIDCMRLDDLDAEGISPAFYNDECLEHDECSSQALELTDGYVGSDKYCVTMMEHRRRHKNDEVRCI